MKEPSVLQRLIKTFKVNNQQLNFGSYSAELSFYIIWAIVPLMLALANVITILPFSSAEIIRTIERILPSEVEDVIIDLLKNYLDSTDSSIFSLGLIISLWPASNVFNTIQRLLNTIYKAPDRQNFVISRIFAYVFTLLLVIAGVIVGFIIVFGEAILLFFRDFINFESQLLSFVFAQSWLIGLISTFLIILSIYHFIPNVNWSIKYAIPGTIFSLIGFSLVTMLFPLYLSIAGGNVGQGAIGVSIVVLIWLYLNGFVFSIGAYINVFVHDFHCKSYWKLLEESTSYRSFSFYSPGIRRHSRLIPGFRNVIYRQVNKKGDSDDIY